MALPIVFANLGAGNQPAADIDACLNAVGTMAVTSCSASGTNTIALVPNVNQTPVPSYTDTQVFSFVAAATSTGNVSVNVASLGAVNLYLMDGVTRATSGNIVSGNYYLIAYGASLNSTAGGFYIVNSSISSGSGFQFSSQYIVSGSTVLTSANAGQLGVITVTGAITLPLANSVSAGKIITLMNAISTNSTFVLSGSDITNVTSLVITPFSTMEFVSDGVSSWRVILRLNVTGGLELISSASASTSAAITFTAINAALYSEHILVGYNVVPTTNATNLTGNFSIAGSFITATAYFYECFRWAFGGTGVDGNTSQPTFIINTPAGPLGNGTNQHFNFVLTIPGLNLATVYKTGWANWAQYSNSPTALSGQTGVHMFTSAAAVDGIRLQMDSGPIASGQFFWYGVRNGT